MLIEQGKQLRTEWKQKGNEPCKHALLGLETSERGYMTGLYLCTACGIHMALAQASGPKERSTAPLDTT